MKKTVGIFLACMLLLTAFLILPVHGEAGIYDNVIRLHVLAESDSAEDQANKLLVRDAVLRESEGLLEGAENRAEAQEILQAALPALERAAEAALLEAGAPNEVNASLTRERYPRRSYEAVALPAGEYFSLQIKIGNAEGQNWWCVLFPPMCLSAASVERESACLAAGLTDEQYRLITQSEGGTYRLRFKILEVAEALFS